MSEDPFAGILDRSSVAQALRDARASLARPTRPFTPASRSLFQQADDSPACSRPSSSYSLDQLKFVRDVFNPPDRNKDRDSLASTRSSLGSRGYGGCQPIPELEEPVLQLADVLEMGAAGVVIQEGNINEPAFPLKVGRRRPAASEAEVTFGRFGLGPDEEYEGGALDDLALRMDLPVGCDESGSEDEAPADMAREAAVKLAQRKESDETDESRKVKKCDQKAASLMRRVSGQSGKALGEDWNAGFQQVLAEIKALNISAVGTLGAGAAGKGVAIEPCKLAGLTETVALLVNDLLAVEEQHQHQAPQLFKVALALMEQKADPESMVRLARCTLALLRLEVVQEDVQPRGTAATYLNVARALFKLSKDDSLDTAFRSEGVAELLLTILSAPSEQNSPDVQVFIVGVLKNVSNNEDNQKLLVKRGALGVLLRLLDSDIGSEKLLIQITALLRNLVSSSRRHKDFLSLGLLHGLVRVMTSHMHSEELQVNISRVLGKLTGCDSTCEELAGDSCTLVQQILRCLATYPGSSSLVMRHAFVLGNLTSKADALRAMLAFEFDGKQLLPSLLDRYWQQDRKLAQIEVAGVAPQSAQAKDGQELVGSATRSTSMQDCEAVLIKLVRLVANVTINAGVGMSLASQPLIVDALLAILGCKKMPESEELVLCTTAATTNILFYDSQDNLLLTPDNKHLLCKLLRPMLLESYNVEALVEAARALGNLSRHQDARHWIAELRIDEVLTILLAHGDRDLVFYSCGALVNLAADSGTASRLCQGRALRTKLAALLQEAPSDDDELLMVAMKVLSNLHLDPHGENQWHQEEAAALQAGLHRVSEICGSEGWEALKELADRLLQALE
eukprot:TRINITY_DN4337_c0_g2_i2.p1 TRINITY_DN4337_c0_g2~~TRINITY_DN4337_c0_g2_i2.p1  ORF type:complete len:850 (+),score=220.80 TRINITY_DN4337_c0_g2_i2:95-2644(+)